MVARNLPSANFRQHTTLSPCRVDVSNTEKEGNPAFVPLMMNKVHLECTFYLGLENGKPITAFFLELGGNTKRVKLVQKNAVLAYRRKRPCVIDRRALGSVMPFFSFLFFFSPSHIRTLLDLSDS